jgi:hypothetical protein
MIVRPGEELSDGDARHRVSGAAHAEPLLVGLREERAEAPRRPTRTVTWLTVLFLTLIPVAVFVVPRLLYPAVGPLSAARHIHPVYGYLFSSLQVAAGEAPQHIDHPGTPVQILGGTVMWLVALLSGAAPDTEALVTAVLAEPERYLQFMSGALGVLVAAALWTLGWRLSAALGGLAYGLIGQLLVLASPSVLLSIHQFTAEGMLIVISLLLGATLVPMPASGAATVDGDAGWGTSGALLLGGLLGLGIATKITMIPFLALVLVPRRLGDKIAAMVAAAATLLVATLPIWSRFEEIASWVTSLIAHSGRYGSGSKGLPPLADMAKGAAKIALNEPGLMLSGAFIVAVLLVSWRRSWEAPTQRLLVCGLLAIAGQCLLALKNPEPRYVLPSAVLACALVPVALHLMLADRAAAMRWVLPVVALLTIGMAVWETTRLVTQRELERASYAMVMAAAEKRDCFVVPFFRSDVPPFALFGGRRKGAFNVELTRIYPDAIVYNVFPTRIVTNAAVRDLAGIGFYRWDERLTLDEVERAAAGREVCLVGDHAPGLVAGRSVERIHVPGAPEVYHAQRLFVLRQP